MPPTHSDALFMQRCLDIARIGRGHVSPNPLVGAVLSAEGRILAEGFHQNFGAAHAEVNALNKTTSTHPKQATLHVSLEPCCHVGKTGACTARILDEGIQNVHVALKDPFPAVSGKGIEILRSNRVNVKSNILTSSASILNSAFLHNIKTKSPYVILKWAESADGFIGKEGEQVWLSNKLSRRLVHKWRSESDAIMVGTKTLLVDNPSLTNRFWLGQSPTRIVVDRRAIVPSTHKVFNKQAKTIYFSTKPRADIDCEQINIHYEIDKMHHFFKQLYTLEIGIIFIEGGAKLLNSLIAQGIWNEARIIKTRKKLDQGIVAPKLPIQKGESYQLGDNKVLRFINEK